MIMAREVIHLLKYLLGMSRARTQTSDSERECIGRHVPGAKRLVEIGVFEGVTTHVIADHMDVDAEFHGVDPFFRGRLGICWNSTN